MNWTDHFIATGRQTVGVPFCHVPINQPDHHAFAEYWCGVVARGRRWWAIAEVNTKIRTDQLRSRPKADQGIFSTYYFFGGKDGFVKIYQNPKAILIDISTFAHTGVVKKTNI